MENENNRIQSPQSLNPETIENIQAVDLESGPQPSQVNPAGKASSGLGYNIVLLNVMASVIFVLGSLIYVFVLGNEIGAWAIAPFIALVQLPFALIKLIMLRTHN